MRKYLIVILLLPMFSCQINPSIMFKTGSNYPYKVDQTIGNVEYRIAPNDILGFSVFTNDGFKLIDLTTGVTSISGSSSSTNSYNNSNSTQFIVDVDGFVKLPIIGRVKVMDFTTREAEKMLEEKYQFIITSPL